MSGAGGRPRLTRYGTSHPSRPKSHDRGTLATVGSSAPENSLLLIQGPLILDWRRRKRGFLPGLENGDLHGGFAPSLGRLRSWLEARVCVAGRPGLDLCETAHARGARAKRRDAAGRTDAKASRVARAIREEARRLRILLHYRYITAYEMAPLVHQAEEGRQATLFEERFTAVAPAH